MSRASTARHSVAAGRHGAVMETIDLDDAAPDIARLGPLSMAGSPFHWTDNGLKFMSIRYFLRRGAESQSAVSAFLWRRLAGKSQAARMLGLTRNALRYRLTQMGLEA